MAKNMIKKTTSPKIACSMAANLIAKHGLAKGNYRDDSGGYCVLGAIGAVVRNSAWDETIERIRTRANITDISEWNDRKCRTNTDVVNMLRKVAK